MHGVGVIVVFGGVSLKCGTDTKLRDGIRRRMVRQQNGIPFWLISVGCCLRGLIVGLILGLILIIMMIIVYRLLQH